MHSQVCSPAYTPAPNATTLLYDDFSSGFLDSSKWSIDVSLTGWYTLQASNPGPMVVLWDRAILATVADFDPTAGCYIRVTGACDKMNEKKTKSRVWCDAEVLSRGFSPPAQVSCGRLETARA